MKNKKIKDICIVSMLTALGVVLSAFLQFRLIGDIKVDLSYLCIIVICYLYGGLIGGFSAMSIATIESVLFTSNGFSISWATANFILGFMIGLIFTLTKDMKKEFAKQIINITTIIISVALGMLLLKTIIECNLYAIPFEVKIVKNLVAFEVDVVVCILGYALFIPKLLRNKIIQLAN